MTPIVVLFVTALASARVSRFLTIDKLAEPYRMWVARKFPPKGDEQRRITYLVFCPWCTAIWVTLVAVLIAWFLVVDEYTTISGWLAVPALWLALAHLAGWWATLGND